MLNPFPIQFLSLLAYAILRVFVGGMLVYLGVRHVKRRHDMKHALTAPFFPFGLFSVWYIATVELIAGVMFILGFYTQIAALIAVLISIKMFLFHRHLASPFIPGRMFYLLLFAASLSLFITGAGAFAFDLPI